MTAADPRAQPAAQSFGRAQPVLPRDLGQRGGVCVVWGVPGMQPRVILAASKEREAVHGTQGEACVLLYYYYQ